MSIKRTLQCEKCLAHKETTESKIRFARVRNWMLGAGIPLLIIGIAGLIGGVFLLKMAKTEETIMIPATLLLANGGLGAALGLVFLILGITKRIANGRLYKCPKCGHRMVPVYHEHVV